MAYFDNAATTYPKPEVVYSYMDMFYRSNGASAGRGKYGASVSAGALIAETRQLIQDLMHCQAKQVVFTPTATVALNIVLQGLIKSGVKEIYISPFEHNAVTRTLHSYSESGQINVHKLAVTDDMVYDIQRIRYQFESEKPDLVIISHASNVFGLIAPIEDIFKLSKQFNAYTVADMAQTAGLVDCNVGSSVFDFAIFAGHKTLYGPTGISGFIMKPEIDLPSVIYGGTGYESANQNMPRSLPERFEMGTMNISVQIQGKENMKQYEIELVDVKKRLKDLNDRKERLIREDATLKNDIERYKKVYDSLVAVSGKNKETMLFIQYAEEILDWLSSTYKEKETFIRDALETKVNHIFEQMYHGHRRVSIDQRYQVTLLTTIEDKEIAAGESEGSNRVKSFAFIAGLVALAKEKLVANAGEEGFNLSSEPYPLVMDAPFSNADEIHTANISKVLPEIAEQVIMFVMQKDWHYAEPVMASRVGKQYTLKKHSETYTVLE